MKLNGEYAKFPLFSALLFLLEAYVLALEIKEDIEDEYNAILQLIIRNIDIHNAINR